MATTGNNQYRYSSATVRMCTLAVKTPSANLKKHCIQTAVFRGPGGIASLEMVRMRLFPVCTSNADIVSQSRTVRGLFHTVGMNPMYVWTGDTLSFYDLESLQFLSDV